MYGDTVQESLQGRGLLCFVKHCHWDTRTEPDNGRVHRLYFIPNEVNQKKDAEASFFGGEMSDVVREYKF